MSHSVTGAVVGSLVSIFIGVSAPAETSFLRRVLAAWLLAGAIMTAAWYLP